MLRKMTAVLAVGVLAIAPAQAENWPQFRGPNCSGISTSKVAMPAKFSPTENVLWSAKIGDGVGCPIVAG